MYTKRILQTVSFIFLLVLSFNQLTTKVHADLDGALLKGDQFQCRDGINRTFPRYYDTQTYDNRNPDYVHKCMVNSRDFQPLIRSAIYSSNESSTKSCYCKVDKTRMSGSSPFCTDFYEYHGPDRKTVHIVNVGLTSASAWTTPPGWKATGGHFECDLTDTKELFGEWCDWCP